MASENCANDHVGVRPLNELKSHLYQQKEGGLYPGGSNFRPAAHDAAGQAIAATIVPLDASGNPSSSGKIAMVALGYSFAKNGCDALALLMKNNAAVAPSIKLVNAAIPGTWTDEIADPNDDYWTTSVPLKLSKAGISFDQVQVVWFMDSMHGATDPFPTHAETMRDLLVLCFQNMKFFFPNLKIVYCDTPMYLGYTDTFPNTEPTYFEMGFAYKWAIEKQINGDADMNYDPALGTVVAPWVSWGAYLWTDGADLRFDGLDWICPIDLKPDGVHQSTIGAAKQAARLYHMLATDLTATPWFLAAGASPNGIGAFVDLFGDALTGTAGVEPRICINQLPALGTAAMSAEVRHALPNTGGFMMLGNPDPNGGRAAYGGKLYIDPNGWWEQPFMTDGSGAASIDLGDVPDDSSYAGVDFWAQVAIYDTGAPHNIALSEALILQLGG